MGKATKSKMINATIEYNADALNVHAIGKYNLANNANNSPWSGKNVVEGVSLSDKLVDVYKLIRKTYPTMLIEPCAAASRMEDADCGEYQYSTSREHRYVYKIAVRYVGSPCYLAIITDKEAVDDIKGFTLSSPAIHTNNRSRKEAWGFQQCTRRFESAAALVKSIKALDDISIPRVLHTYMLKKMNVFQRFVRSEPLKLESELKMFGGIVRGSYQHSAEWTKTVAFIVDAVNKVERGEGSSLVIPPHVQEAYNKYRSAVMAIAGSVDAETNKHVVMVATFQGTSKVYCTYLGGMNVSTLAPFPYPYPTVSYDGIEQLPYLIQRKLHTLAVSVSPTPPIGDYQEDGVGICMPCGPLGDYIATELYAVGVDDETVSTLELRAMTGSKDA